MADPTTTTKRISKLSRRRKTQQKWSTPPMYKKKAKVVHFNADSKSTTKRITLSTDPEVSSSSSSLDDMAVAMPYAAAPTSTPNAPSTCHAFLPEWANGLVKATAEQAETMIQSGEYMDLVSLLLSCLI